MGVPKDRPGSDVRSRRSGRRWRRGIPHPRLRPSTFAPAAAAAGASLGLVVFGIIGLIVTNSRSTPFARRRAAIAVSTGGIISAAALTFLLLEACPLYVMHAGYCSHGNVDVLGGWISGVIALYVFDVLTLTGLVLASPRWPE